MLEYLITPYYPKTIYYPKALNYKQLYIWYKMSRLAFSIALRKEIKGLNWDGNDLSLILTISCKCPISYSISVALAVANFGKCCLQIRNVRMYTTQVHQWGPDNTDLRFQNHGHKNKRRSTLPRQLIFWTDALQQSSLHWSGSTKRQPSHKQTNYRQIYITTLKW